MRTWARRRSRRSGSTGCASSFEPGGARRTVTIPGLGRLSVHNALAGAAVGLAAGMTLDEIAAGLADGWSAPHRVAIVRLGGVTIVDDSYNASPRSVIAALDLLAGLPGRRGAVLGEMLELGDASEEGHREVGEAAARTVDWLMVVGSGAPGHRRGRRGGRHGQRPRSSTSATPRPPCRPCRRASATATSSWSRRRAASPSIPSSTASGASSAAGGAPGDERIRPGRAHPGPAPRVRPDGHPHVAVHPRPARARVRQADPPGGAGEPLHQGGHAHDGRPPDRRGRHRHLLLPARRVRTHRPSRRWRRSPASVRWAPSTTT